MQGLYSIGDFARLTRVSVDTLRFYDKKGLLTPEVIDPKSKYRYYSYSQLVKLDIIKQCRMLDISIDEIVKLFSQANSSAFEVALQKQMNMLQEKITELEHIHETMHLLLQRMKESKNILSLSDCYEREIAQRTIILSKEFGCPLGDHMPDAKAFLELTETLRSQCCVSHYVGGYFYRVAQGQIVNTAMFEVVDETPAALNFELHILPAGKYFCMHYSKEETQSSMEVYLQQLHVRGYDTDNILGVYLIDGAFQPSNRKFEFQCFIKETEPPQTSAGSFPSDDATFTR
ncbi:MAG: helix-turn-helix domain-containing protein [Angelakisella sp.]